MIIIWDTKSNMNRAKLWWWWWWWSTPAWCTQQWTIGICTPEETGKIHLEKPSIGTTPWRGWMPKECESDFSAQCEEKNGNKLPQDLESNPPRFATQEGEWQDKHGGCKECCHRDCNWDAYAPHEWFDTFPMNNHTPKSNDNEGTNHKECNRNCGDGCPKNGSIRKIDSFQIGAETECKYCLCRNCGRWHTRNSKR